MTTSDLTEAGCNDPGHQATEVVAFSFDGRDHILELPAAMARELREMLAFYAAMGRPVP